MHGLLGKKLGMTHVYDETGRLTPVTIVEAGPCFVTQVKTKETDGYTAIQLGFGEKKARLVKHVDEPRFKKASVTPKVYVREIRVKDVSAYKLGQKIEAHLFAKGDFVDVEAISIGRGFQGGVRRWGWKGGPGGHGSMFHRAVGSIQSGARLGRVTKGHHLPGHMGCDQVTMQNLEIVKVDKEHNLIAVKGSVPGHRNCYLIMCESIKMPKGYIKYKPQAVTPKKGAKGPGAGAAKK